MDGNDIKIRWAKVRTKTQDLLAQQEGLVSSASPTCLSTVEPPPVGRRSWSSTPGKTVAGFG